ncbi:unnamed protein product [Sphenostylis stenocarpa]|uniref:Uncharacterized protein n=1 Tax=Sphenostylis stenocarpa TaxID=92480 RepID=A0AA86RNH8_9FABA|nr:unnamed protein product [Sphenostylis stenocarpa]
MKDSDGANIVRGRLIEGTTCPKSSSTRNRYMYGAFKLLSTSKEISKPLVSSDKAFDADRNQNDPRVSSSIVVSSGKFIASSSRMCLYIPSHPPQAGLHPPDLKGSSHGANICEAQYETLK